MSSALVSVIIPTYYRNDHLPSAIRSALSQSHDAAEVIVVDDSGERHAESVMHEWRDDDRVEYVPLDENRGSQKAREAGVEHANGDFLQFLDDDDRLHPQKFENQLSIFERSEHGVVYGGLTLRDGRTISPREDVRGDVLDDALAFSTWPCCIGTMLIDADLYEQIRPIKNRAEDYRIRIECAHRTTFGFVDEPLISVGVDTDDSLGASSWQIEGLEEILREYRELYTRYPEAEQAARGRLAVKQARETRQTVLESSWWSWRAIRESFRAARLAPEDQPKQAAIALATLAGRPGLELGERLVSS